MLRSLPAIRALLIRLGQRHDVRRSVFKLDGFIEAAGPGHSGQFVRAQALTYVKSTSINLMAGIPSYFSGSNPYLSNFRLAACSTCDLKRSKFSRAPYKSRTFVGSICDRAS